MCVGRRAEGGGGVYRGWGTGTAPVSKWEAGERLEGPPGAGRRLKVVVIGGEGGAGRLGKDG